MNLPDTAIEFLDAFRGIFRAERPGGQEVARLYDDERSMPMIHCYCFTRELEPDKAEMDIRQVSQHGFETLIRAIDPDLR